MFDIILSFQLETCFITKSLNLKIFQMKGILFKIRGFSIRFLFINIVRNILTLFFCIPFRFKSDIYYLKNPPPGLTPPAQNIILILSANFCFKMYEKEKVSDQHKGLIEPNKSGVLEVLFL